MLESEFYVYENETKPMLDAATEDIWNDFMNYCKGELKIESTSKKEDNQ